MTIPMSTDSEDGSSFIIVVAQPGFNRQCFCGWAIPNPFPYRSFISTAVTISFTKGNELERQGNEGMMHECHQSFSFRETRSRNGNDWCYIHEMGRDSLYDHHLMNSWLWVNEWIRNDDQQAMNVWIQHSTLMNRGSVGHRHEWCRQSVSLSFLHSFVRLLSLGLGINSWPIIDDGAELIFIPDSFWILLSDRMIPSVKEEESGKDPNSHSWMDVTLMNVSWLLVHHECGNHCHPSAQDHPDMNDPCMKVTIIGNEW